MRDHRRQSRFHLGKKETAADVRGSTTPRLACISKPQVFILQGMKRACEPLFAEYLAAFPCIAIFGPRLCSKTTLAGALPADWRRFDLERGSDRDFVARDPDLFFRLRPRGTISRSPTARFSGGGFRPM
jgi:hypothetical protein